MKEYNRLKFLVIVVIILFISSISACQKNSESTNVSNFNLDVESLESLKIAIDKALLSEMEQNHIPGIAMVLVKDGETIYKKGYGVANMLTEKKVDPDKTIFRIGSISKALTLLTLTKLVDEGRVNINDDVSNYFSHINNLYNVKKPITIKHLLTHSSGFDQIGIGRHVYDFELPLDKRKSRRPSIFNFLKSNNLRRINPPGQYYRYDTYGTVLAGHIIEKVTGFPYREAMKKELFDVIGMNRSSVEINPENMNDLAVGHGYNNEQYQIMPYEVYVTQPASSIDATPADMGKLLEVLTNNGANKNGKLFSPEMTKNILAPQFRPHPEFVGISHGMQESNYVGVAPEAYAIRTLGHGGDMLGITSTMILIPSLNMGVFVTANRNGESGGGPVFLWRLIMNTILDHFEFKKEITPYSIAPSNKSINLDEYIGNYYFGVFCHSCSQEEYNQGGWQRRSQGHEVKVVNDTLIIDGDKFIPNEDDVFVRSDGYEKVYFGRDENDNVIFLVFSDEVNPFEKSND